jgi:fructoselysine-6-P-deglycase FrlB-like protein
MDKIEEEISQQPAAMKSLLKYYLHGDGRGLLEKIAVDSKPLFTGMGASYHAAAIAAMQCQQAGIPAAAFETTDLLTPVPALLNTYSPLIYISQSGESAEVPYFLRRIEQGPLLGVTNDEQSTLALSATTVLPLHAGEETLIASKTYLNTLSLMWLVGRRISNTWDGTEEDRVNRVAKRVNLLLTGRNSLLTAWHDVMENAQHLVFTGRGPQAVAARQGAMVMAEWGKRHVQFISLGGFRHGFIELSEPGMGVVIFANSTAGLDSELDLANELDEYGVNVLLVIDGMTRRIRENPPEPVGFDPFLGTILSAIPPQLWAIELSRSGRDGQGFRHLKKVIKKI